jgi:predicted amidohydrolase
MRVVGLQMEVTTDVTRNVDQLVDEIGRAAEVHADVLLTPEGALSGYHAAFDRAEVRDALDVVTRTAAQHRMGLALGTCFEEDDGIVSNQLRFYEPDGTYVGCHTKTLLCGSLESPSHGEIEHYATKPLSAFVLGGRTIGGLICNDLWANPMCTPMDDPHLVQRLVEMGADLVFHAVNGGRDGGDWSREVAFAYHETNLRLRARAARVWLVTVDSCSPTTVQCSSPSGVIGPDGAWAIRAPERGRQRFVFTIPDPVGLGD